MARGEPTRSNWTRIDRTKDPQAFIRLLDATRRRWLVAARADPPAFFEYLRLRPGLRVLEVGCGPGDFDRAMAPLVLPAGRITAVDYSETMIHEETERLRGTDLPIDFRQADVHALPFEAGTFDRALATQVFQHLPGPEKGLEEMVRVVRPGGWVVITEPDWDTRVISLSDRNVARAVARKWAEGVPNAGIARQLPRMFRDAGLTNVRIDPSPYLLSENDPETVRELVALPLEELREAGAISDDDARTALQNVEERILDGSFVDMAILLRVFGEKA